MTDELVRINAKAVRQHVKANGLKWYWVADKAGIAQTTLRRALSGPRKRVKLSTAQNLARVLELPVSYIAKGG
jgi:transcriptional regulator with XRE-family HTH domain